MAEEAGAPQHARRRLHGVQREPHATAAGQGDGIFAGGLLLTGGRTGKARDRNANSVLPSGMQRTESTMVDAAPAVIFSFLEDLFATL